MPLAHRLANTGTLQTNTYFDEYTQGYLSNYFNGTSRVTTPSSSAFALGTSYTIEGWLYRQGTTSNYSNYISVIGTQPLGTAVTGFFVLFDPSGNFFLADSSNAVPITYSLTSLNTWYHFAFVRNGSGAGNVKLYINGVSVATGTSSGTQATNQSVFIGMDTNSAGGFVGYMSNMRITNTAVYTSAFTPSTTPLTAVSGTQLLTCQSSNFKDNSINNFTITVNGSVTSNTVSPFSKTPRFTANNIIGQLDEYTISPLNPNNQVGDPYFNQVSLLLHGDAANGSNNNTFLDSSANNFTITRNGNTTQGTNTPFSQADGYWSNYFDGNSYLYEAISLTPLSLTGDFTIECWAYVQGSNDCVLVGSNNVGGQNNQIFRLNSSGSNSVYIYLNGTAFTSTNNAYTLNTWNHYALTRSGSTVTLYVNGTSRGSMTYSGTIYPNEIGGLNGSQNMLIGYLSNVRIVNGTVVYTSNFTPSTTPLTAITNTALLTCQSNYFKDNSSNNFTITATGTPSVQPFSPFAPTSAYSTSVNGGSMYFDGTGDYLTFSSISLTADFTVECWVYKTAVDASGYTNLFSGGTTQWIIDLTTAGSIALYLGGTAILAASGTAVVANAWNHISFVREGTTVRGYVNGIQQVTGTSSSALPISYLGAYSGGGYEMNGCVSNVRILNGTCLYPSGTTFTPPTAPLTAITNTSLLLSGTNAGIFDNAIKNDLETVGNAQVSTSVVKYGTGSMSFDGSSYLKVPSSANLTLGSGDWTIEFWAYLNSVSGQPFFFDQRTADPEYTPCLYSSGAGNGIFSYYLNGADRITASTALTTGQWYHIALCRSSGNTKLFYNGTQTGSTYADSGTYLSGQFVIGTRSRTFDYNLNAYIDDFRVTRGVSRYTANFTPPTQVFYNKGGISNITSSKVLSLSNTGIITVNGQFDEITKLIPPPAIGDPYGGGYYAGQISLTANGVATHNLIVADVTVGQSSSKTWGVNGVDTGVTSVIDGPTNTATLAALGATYEAATFCKAVTAGGYNDWYMPATNELLQLYYYFKPYATNNNTGYGSNAYAVSPEPISTNYTASNPPQTPLTNFRNGASSQEFSLSYYWASTDQTTVTARQQYFFSGDSGGNYKSNTAYVRAVRRVPV